MSLLGNHRSLVSRLAALIHEGPRTAGPTRRVAMKRLVEEDPMWDALSILRLDTGTAKDDKSPAHASIS